MFLTVKIKAFIYLNINALLYNLLKNKTNFRDNILFVYSKYSQFVLLNLGALENYKTCATLEYNPFISLHITNYIFI